MNKKARQMPDGNYSFAELRGLWKQGSFTLEECITQLLHAMVRFDKRRTQLDFKLLPYKTTEEGLEALQSYEALQVKVEIKKLLQAMKKDKKMTYAAMDFALEHFSILELRFNQFEQECEEMIRRLDTTSSHLN